MKKFTLMILGVSTFFTILGGAAKNLENYLTSGDSVVTFVRTSDKNACLPETLEKSKSFLIINKIKERKPDFNIRIASPKMSNEPLEFERQPSRDPLLQGVELPRISENDVLIPRNDLENTDDSAEAKTSHIRVFINKEKKSE